MRYKVGDLLCWSSMVRWQDKYYRCSRMGVVTRVDARERQLDVQTTNPVATDDGTRLQLEVHTYSEQLMIKLGTKIICNRPEMS